MTHCTIVISKLAGSKWVLGENLCYFLATFRWIPGTAGHLLILIISIHRVWTIQRPLNCTVRCRTILIVSVFVWLLSLAPSLSAVIVQAGDHFNCVIKTCESTFYNLVQYKALLSLLSFTFLLLPMLLVLALNGYLLYVSLRHKLSYRGLRTVIFVCGLFVLSILPYNINVIMRALNRTIPIGFEVFYSYVYPLNSSVNPILYTYTNRQFRKMFVCIYRRHIHRK